MEEFGGPIEVMPGEPRAGITEERSRRDWVSGILYEGTHGDGCTKAGARSRRLTAAPGRQCRRGLDNDHIDLMPNNSTQNRSQPWQPVPALRDAHNAIKPVGDDRPARVKWISRSLAQVALAIPLQV